MVPFPGFKWSQVCWKFCSLNYATIENHLVCQEQARPLPLQVIKQNIFFGLKFQKGNVNLCMCKVFFLSVPISYFSWPYRCYWSWAQLLLSMFMMIWEEAQLPEDFTPIQIQIGHFSIILHHPITNSVWCQLMTLILIITVCWPKKIKSGNENLSNVLPKSELKEMEWKFGW